MAADAVVALARRRAVCRSALRVPPHRGAGQPGPRHPPSVSLSPSPDDELSMLSTPQPYVACDMYPYSSVASTPFSVKDILSYDDSFADYPAPPSYEYPEIPFDGYAKQVSDFQPSPAAVTDQHCDRRFSPAGFSLDSTTSLVSILTIFGRNGCRWFLLV